MNQAASPRGYRITRPYDGKSAESRRRQRRDLIIETGIHLIGRQGFAAVSLNAICAEAGLSKRYFYESFSSVEELLHQAFLRIASELQHQLISCIGAQRSPGQMITAGFACFFDYIRDHPERGKLLLVESLAVAGPRQELLGGGGGELSPWLLQMSSRFTQPDVLPQPVLALLAQGAIGAAIFIGQNWIATDYRQPLEELVQGVSEICFGIAQRLGVTIDQEPSRAGRT